MRPDRSGASRVSHRVSRAVATWIARITLGALAAGSGTRAGAAPAWTALHFSTGASFNHTLAVADLNGDGKLDVAIANSQLSAVTVLLGNGDGTLASFTGYATFSEPQDVRVGDLTGDGLLDLVTPDYAANGVTVLRGAGDGTFATRVAHPVGAGLVSIVPVDLDGDGRLDLAMTKESGNKLAILPALAAGGFGTAIEVATGATPHQIDTADLNHDGKPDLVLTSFGAGTVSVHLGNGTHTPGPAIPYVAGAAPIGVAIADLNGDGDADLLVTNVNAATLSVLLGNGDGTFASRVVYPTDARPRGMDTGDVDGDEVPDVVVATGYPDGDSVLTVYRGLGDGTLAIADHLRLPYRAADCVLADMNADGHEDIVVTGPQAGLVSVLLNPASTLDAPAGGASGEDLALRVGPNPMHRSTTLHFRSPPGVEARLEILDVTGRRVAEMGPFTGTGRLESLTWRGEQADGEPARPGFYLVRLRAGKQVLRGRLLLLRH
jgi:hypothetical protein